MERLAEGPVLGDGGYLLELEKRGYVQAGPFTPEVVIDHPEALAELHREFLRAGAEVLQTMTFYASEDKLATVGLGGRSTTSTGTPCASPGGGGRGRRPGRGQPVADLGLRSRRRRRPDHVRAPARRAAPGTRSTPVRPTSGSARRSPTWARRCCSWSGPSDRPAGHGHDVVRDSSRPGPTRATTPATARAGSPTRAPTSWASTASTRPPNSCRSPWRWSAVSPVTCPSRRSPWPTPPRTRSRTSPRGTSSRSS